MINVSIYGIGNFGYAFLKHLDNKKQQGVALKAYDRNTEVVRKLIREQSHPYFHSGVKVSKRIVFLEDVEELVSGCDVLILAVSSDATREVIEAVKPHLPKNVIILNTAKALDYSTGQRLSEIIKDQLTGKTFSYAIAAGGTIAKDLFEHEPLGMDVACNDADALEKLVDIVSSNNLTVYPSKDLLGVEYASAFKNVVAILAGIINGMGFSYGAETHLISKIAGELKEILVENYGAEHETLSIASQCWGNDLWMSCTGKTRNREFGELVGRSGSVDQSLKKMRSQQKTVEGLNTVKILKNLKISNDIVELDYLYKLLVERSVSVDDMRRLLTTNVVNYIK